MSGQERFSPVGCIYNVVKSSVKELRKMLGNNICLCIAGNKIDLEKERHVPVAEAESLIYAASVGAKHFHTSAKLNKGIEEMFLDLSRSMIGKAGENNHKNSKIANNRQNVLVVEDERSPTKSGSGCC